MAVVLVCFKLVNFYCLDNAQIGAQCLDLCIKEPHDVSQGMLRALYSAPEKVYTAGDVRKCFVAKAHSQLVKCEKAIADAEDLLTEKNCPDTLRGQLLGSLDAKLFQLASQKRHKSLPEWVDWESCMEQFVDECSKALGKAIVNPWPVPTCSSTTANNKSSKEKGAKDELVGNFGF